MATIGNFDGVHLGHRVLIGQLIERAKHYGVPSVVVTFDPHPIEVLNPGVILPKLNTLERKAELLGECGVDYLLALETDPALLNLEYTDFFSRYVTGRLNARALVEGPNFFFGKDRQGDTAALRDLCRRHGIELKIVEIRHFESDAVSSSLVRKWVMAGNVGEANRVLGTHYTLTGVVEPGAGRGRSIGFPTANLQRIATLVPGDGVYGGVAKLGERRALCAVNIGSNLTFSESEKKIEVHLIDRDLDLYGAEITVEFHRRLRGLIKFESVEKLVAQIEKDIAEVQENVTM